MADTNTIIIGAAGVVIGALITQIFTAVNNYFSDKRKYNSEQRQALLIRKISIGEEFYALNGLAIQSFKKTLHYLETRDTLRTDEAIQYLEQNLNDRNNYLQSIIQREKVYTAINLYYNIKSNFETSQDFENNYIGLVTKIKDLTPEEGNTLDLYIKLNSQLIMLLQENIETIESDRVIVKNEVKHIMDQFFD